MFNNFDLNQLVVMIVPLLFAVTVHEVAHGFIAYRMGDPTAMLAGRLSLNPIKHLDLVGSFILPLALKFSGSPFIFGYAKPVPVNFANFRNYRKGMFYVSSAGVLANLALAVVSGVGVQFMLHFKTIWYTTVFRPIVFDLYHMLWYSVIINSVLAVFNLIPIPPLDGSRIVAMLLPPGMRDRFARMERYGMIIIIFLLMTGTLSKLMSFFLNPLIRILLGS
ncbi:MAG: site-2 protease family protein [Proteobacteria bacterium]|nr:site-2 protease family protein [Pseudomonadota bacterium]